MEFIFFLRKHTLTNETTKKKYYKSVKYHFLGYYSL